jgi:hypothetical protein
LFYGEEHEPRASTVEKVRRAAAARAREEQDAKAEHRDVRERLAILEARLAAIDPEFFSASIDGIRNASLAVGKQTGGSGGSRGAVESEG